MPRRSGRKGRASSSVASTSTSSRSARVRATTVTNPLEPGFRMSTIDYYISLNSPWTYLGSARFAAIAHKHGYMVDLKPVKFAEVFSKTGGLPLGKRSPERRAYRIMDLKRCARPPRHPDQYRAQALSFRRSAGDATRPRGQAAGPRCASSRHRDRQGALGDGAVPTPPCFLRQRNEPGSTPTRSAKPVQATPNSTRCTRR